MIRHAEGRRRTTVDSDDDYVNGHNPLFDLINSDPRCGIYLHVTSTKQKEE